jgi:hypothetical protein
LGDIRERILDILGGGGVGRYWGTHIDALPNIYIDIFPNISNILMCFPISPTIPTLNGMGEDIRESILDTLREMLRKSYWRWGEEENQK